MTEQLVSVGTIRRTHGVRGEVQAALSPDQIELVSTCPDVVVRQAGSTRTLSIASVRGTSDRAIICFEEISDMDAAAELRGAEICLPRSAFPEAAPGNVLHVDLEGIEVRAAASGDVLGSVQAIRPYPGGDVLVISGARGEAMIPYAAAVIDETRIGDGVLLVNEDLVAWQGGGDA